LFAHVLLPRGLQFIKAKKHFNCPMLVLEHASYYRPAMRKRLSSVQRTIMKRTSVYIKRLMAVSEVLKKDMRPIFPTTQIDIIPEFVQLEHFKLKENLAKEKKKFLHISTLDPLTKNPILLCEGFKLAIEQTIKEKGFCDISLTIVSDQNTEKWKNWVNDNQLSDYITFVGPATWEEIGAYVQAHDTLILTSVYETFSIVIVEAWLTGTPVISTSVGVALEMPDFLGRNVEQDNSLDLAQTITAFSKGTYDFNPVAIREHALQFTDERVLSELKIQFERYFDMHD
jgi:glycosyltransferase involved in cell wall biosynthesis